MKNALQLIGIALILMVLAVGIGGCKYAVWRAEHPEAATWTFFIPKGSK